MNKKLVRYIVCVGMLLTCFSTLGVPFASAEAPAAPSGPYPASGSNGVTIFIRLHWTGDNQSLTYDVYFGTDNQPPLVVANQSTTRYNPGTLQVNTTYYWQIVAYNAQQESNTSPIWNFTTAPDTPPFRPMILGGPSAAGTRIMLNFTAVAPDPEGDQVFYQWDWGDGNMSDWFGPYAFGEHSVASYQYPQNGSYNIVARAKDIHGEVSDWSVVYPITIARQIEITNLKRGYAYFHFFGYDLGYAYIYSLDLLGMTLVISNSGFNVNTTITDNVRFVEFEMVNLFYPDQKWTTVDDNASNGISLGYFELTPGLYQTTAYAYDANHNLIDRSTRNYVIFYQWKFSIIKALLSKLSGGSLP